MALFARKFFIGGDKASTLDLSASLRSTGVEAHLSNWNQTDRSVRLLLRFLVGTMLLEELS